MPADTRRRERLDVGLYVRTTAAGDTRYDVAVWQGGRQQVRALPRGTSEREARKAALRARAAASMGTGPMGSAMRLEALVDEYLEHAEARTRVVGNGRLSDRTVVLYRQRLRDYVTPAIGRRKLSELGKRRCAPRRRSLSRRWALGVGDARRARLAPGRAPVRPRAGRHGRGPVRRRPA